MLFHLFDNCCLPKIKRKRRQKRLAYFNSGFSYNAILCFLEKYHDTSISLSTLERRLYNTISQETNRRQFVWRQNPVSEFTKTIIPFALVGYEVIITNSRYALVGYFYYHFISNSGSWNNCYLVYTTQVNSTFRAR